MTSATVKLAMRDGALKDVTSEHAYVDTIHIEWQAAKYVKGTCYGYEDESYRLIQTYWQPWLFHKSSHHLCLLRHNS